MTTKTTTGGRAAEGGREGGKEKEEARKRKERRGGRQVSWGKGGKRRIWQQVGGIEADPSAGTDLKITRGGRMRGYASRLQTQLEGREGYLDIV